MKKEARSKAPDERYVIVRTYSAGCFAGLLESRDGKEVVLRNARRLWHWKGAQTLSCLAAVGTNCPKECRVSVGVRVTLTEAIEIIDCTEAGRRSLESIPVWTA